MHIHLSTLFFQFDSYWLSFLNRKVIMSRSPIGCWPVCLLLAPHSIWFVPLVSSDFSRKYPVVNFLCTFFTEPQHKAVSPNTGMLSKNCVFGNVNTCKSKIPWFVTDGELVSKSPWGGGGGWERMIMHRKLELIMLIPIKQFAMFSIYHSLMFSFSDTNDNTVISEIFINY